MHNTNKDVEARFKPINTCAAWLCSVPPKIFSPRCWSPRCPDVTCLPNQVKFGAKFSKAKGTDILPCSLCFLSLPPSVSHISQFTATGGLSNIVGALGRNKVILQVDACDITEVNHRVITKLHWCQSSVNFSSELQCGHHLSCCITTPQLSARSAVTTQRHRVFSNAVHTLNKKKPV